MRRLRRPIALGALLLAALDACGEFGMNEAAQDPPALDASSLADATGAPAPVDDASPGVDAAVDAALACTSADVVLRCAPNDAGAGGTCLALNKGKASSKPLEEVADGGGLLLTPGSSDVAGVFWVDAPWLGHEGFRISAEGWVRPQSSKPADGFALAFVQRDDGYDASTIPRTSGAEGSDFGVVGMTGFHGVAAMVRTYAPLATATVGQLELGVQDLREGEFRSAELAVPPTFAAGDGVHVRLVVERREPGAPALAALYRQQPEGWELVSTKSFELVGAFELFGASAASGALASAQQLERLETCRTGGPAPPR